MEPKESYVQRAQKWFMEGGRGRNQRIARHARAGEQGWEPLWVSKMDYLVGKVVTIESMDHHGNVYIEESDYYFPYFIFEEAKVANSSREAERKAIYVAGAMRCGLKKGDRAKIYRRAKTREAGWPSSWFPDMNCYVSNVVTIKSINSKGCVFVEESYYGFPYFVFEPVDVPDRVVQGVKVEVELGCFFPKDTEPRATRKIKLIESTNHFLKVRV